IRGPFPIGFDFPYYWYTVNEFYFSTNGAISFSDNTLYHVWPSMGYTTELPSPTRPNDILVPLGGDFIFGSAGGGSAYYWTNDTDTSIISWIAVPEWNADSGYHGSHTFQIILTREDSCIVFQYGPQTGTFMCGTADDPKTAIGIENSSGMVGLQYLWDNSPQENMYEEGLAVKFIPPVTGSPVRDVSVIETTAPGNRAIFLLPGDTLRPWLKIKNLGNQLVGHFYAYCKVVNHTQTTVYLDSVVVTDIAPGEIDSISMPSSWVPENTGIFATSGYVVVEGDMAPANDVIVVETPVTGVPGVLSYDDGICENAWAYTYAGNGWANKFTPPRYPVRVTEINYFIYGASFPDPGGNDLIVWVLDDDGEDGAPGTILFGDTLLGTVIRGAWNDIDLGGAGVIIEDGSFYVAAVQYADYPYCPAISCDENIPYSRQAWSYLGSTGAWEPDPTQLHDWMINAHIEIPPGLDAELVSINSPGDIVGAGSQITPQVTVGNAGLTTISFDAHLLIDSLGSTIYDEALAVNDLEPSGTRDIDFPTWTPGGEGNTYTITACVDLAGDDNSSNDTLFATTIVAGGDYLVWDPDPNHSSGPIIDSILEDLGYAGYYTEELSNLYGFLEQYFSIFICCGQFPNKHVLLNGSAEADSIVHYTENGGRLYLEGGDVWYIDPEQEGGYDFRPLFGVTGGGDGPSTLTLVTGENGTITEGMSFTYSGESRYSNYVEPAQATMALKNQSDNYIGHYYNSGAYITFGFSAELEGLDDCGGVSTRRQLLQNIMTLFETGVEENHGDINEFSVLWAPNIFSGKAVLSYQIPRKSRISVNIYDISGRLVKKFTIYDLRSTNNEIVWDGKDERGLDVASGIYLYHFETKGYSRHGKLILVR
ncbi:hypothetical protein CH333_03485, partial [candidate division WOR-3 bacterium JGI_Cruoil_03_44_89]